MPRTSRASTPAWTCARTSERERRGPDPLVRVAAPRPALLRRAPRALSAVRLCGRSARGQSDREDRAHHRALGTALAARDPGGDAAAAVARLALAGAAPAQTGPAQLRLRRAAPGDVLDPGPGTGARRRARGRGRAPV